MIGQAVTLFFKGDASGIAASAKTSVTSIMSVGKAAGLLALGAGAALFAIGAQFDDMKDTISNATGASGKALDDMVGSAKKIATEIPASFEETSTAIGKVKTSLNLTGPELEARTKQFLQLANVTGGDVTTQIDKVSKSFQKWGVTAANQGPVMDKMLYVSQQTGVGVEELADQLTKFQNPLQQMGFSLDSSIAMLGSWSQAGFNVDQILSGMSKGFATLAKAGKDPQAAMTEITKSIKDAKTEGEAAKIAMGTFGAKAGPELAAAIRSGKVSIDELMQGMAGSKGQINESETATRDFAEQWEMFKNKVLVKLEPIATKVFGAITTAMTWINDNAIPIVIAFGTWLKDHLVAAFQAVARWVDENSTLLLTLGAAIGAMLVPLLLYQGYMLVINGAMQVYNGVVKLVTAGQWLWNAAMSANPIGIVIAIILGLVAAFVVLWNKSAGFRDFFIGIWTAIKTAVKVAAQWVTDHWNGVVDFFREMPGKITGFFSKFGDGIKNIFKGAVNGIIDLLNGGIGLINKLLHGINNVSKWIGIPAIPDIPKIPKLHTGGVVQGRPGEEVLTVLRAGEKVTANGLSAGGGDTITLRGNVDSGFAKYVQRLINTGQLVIN